MNSILEKYRSFRLYVNVFITMVFGFGYNLFSAQVDSIALNYPYIHYSTKKGLPSNETFCVFQDSRGYIWIGTDRGLVKYDGYKFKTYTTLDGLVDNVVLSINEDSKGNIWYSCLNNVQIGYIDLEMRFHSYEYHENILDLVDYFNLRGIHFDEMYTDGDDIYLMNNRYGCIVVNDKGIKYADLAYYCVPPVGEYAQIKLFNHNNFRFAYSTYANSGFVDYRVDLYDEKENYRYSYIKDSPKNLFPTITFDKDSMLRIYDGTNYLSVNKDFVVEHTKLKNQCSVFQLNKDKYIYSIYGESDKHGELYYSTSPDVNDPKIKIFDNARVSSAILDLNDGVWITTLRKGVLYIPKLSSKYIEWKEPIESIVPLENNLILKTKNTAFKYVYNSDLIQRKDIVFNPIDAVYKFQKVSFFGYVKKNQDLQLEVKSENIFGIRGVQVMSDSLMYLWSNSRCLKIKNEDISTRFFSSMLRNTPIPHKESMYCFKEDSCILGTRDGLYLFTSDTILDLNKEERKRIRLIDYFESSKTIVYSIWGEGITLENSKGEIIKISDNDGLVSNTINSMYMDESETLWLGTNNGINAILLDSTSGEYIVNTISQASNNLSSPNVLQIYYQDSILYLGTDLGFDVLDLKLNKEIHQSNIPIFLDSIEINNKRYKEINHSIVLSYDSNNLTFHYTAIAFNNLGNVRYRYKLEGLSDHWVNTGERNVSFQQISPGNYTFHLQAQNERGEWVSLKESPSFTIEKPYWETWWFRLLIVGIIGYIIYYYVSNLKREKSLLEDKQILSGELNESRQKALSAQLNPHFVFNSLNSIQNFILTRRTELSSDYLSMFSKLMRFVFENSRKLYVPLSDEVEALRLYLELEQVRHSHKFEYKINIDCIYPDKVYMPSLLVQPIIENAIWHGLLHKKEDDRVLEVNFTSDTEYLYIDVRDNGVGRGGSKPRPKFIKKQKSSGVELTQQRLSLLTQSSGLKTDFKIVDLFDNNGNQSGTLVRITIPINLDE